MRRVMGAFLLLVAMATIPGRVLAETEVYTFIADYNWREHDGNSLVARERGPVYGVGIAGIYLTPAPNPLSLKVKAEGYGASHDFHSADAYGALDDSGDLAGFTLEGDVGMPMKLAGGSTFEPFAGLGYRYWGRSVPSRTKDASNNYTFTYYDQHETWWNFYGKAGLRVTHRLPGSPLRMFAEGGARIPFATQATIDFNNLDSSYREVNVSPGRRLSGFAEAGIKANLFKVSLFYEGLRFAGSQERMVTSTLIDKPPPSFWVRQNHTSADIFGLKIGISF